jgi:FixJ family two-component response regulator
MPADRNANRDRIVVLLDDDAAVLSSLSFALELEGFSVQAYQTAAQLLAGADALNAACLVLDFYLREADGLDVLQTLRAKGVSAPAILITTYPSALLRSRARAAGVELIEKPLLGNTLLDSIRTAMAK